MSTNFPFGDEQPENNWEEMHWQEAPDSSEPATDEQIDFEVMMSMALDGLLDEDEMTQFNADIQYYPLLAEKWATWQELDQLFVAEPSIMPPTNFVQNFEARLSKKQQRRKVWFGVGIASVTVLLWLSIIIGMLSAGAYIATNQGGWINDQAQSLVYLINGFGAWVQTTANTVNIVLYSPQMWGIALAYTALMGGILAYWTRLLRRSTQALNVSSA